jgi:hypothetical protein
VRVASLFAIVLLGGFALSGCKESEPALRPPGGAVTVCRSKKFVWRRAEEKSLARKVTAPGTLQQMNRPC